MIDIIWSNRPKELVKPFFSLSTKNAGTATEKKIIQVKDVLSKNSADYLLVTAPENVAWILNIRGYDSSYSPIPNARLLVSKKEVLISLQAQKMTKIKRNLEKKYALMMKEELKKNILKHMSKKRVWTDSLSCSFYYKSILDKRNSVVEKIDPIHFFKSIKK